jgi:uncharacterized membrane protein YphA (DoxX/SURF4 family)
MKIIVNIARLLVGGLFIFSGLVKAIDPLGLSYKMQEFFEAWAAGGFLKGLMESLTNYSLPFSLIMIALEVILGVALLLGWQKKITTWLLLLLTIFFTFLTSYVLFSGKIRACGCFGDCIPLTPIQTFTKDIILLLLILLILFGQKHIQPLFKKSISNIIILLTVILISLLQWYVLKHLPLVDCLPFKKGSNIAEGRKMPIDAVQDKYDYVFVYEKEGQRKEFKVATGLPDSTWKFADRKQVLITKGKNNIPLINDLIFKTENENDTTDAILNQQGEYYLLFMKEVQDIKDATRATMADINFINAANAKGKKVFVVTSQPAAAIKRYKVGAAGITIPITVFTCDATAIKTAARADAVLYQMNGPVVVNKWSAADFDKAEKKL